MVTPRRGMMGFALIATLALVGCSGSTYSTHNQPDAQDFSVHGIDISHWQGDVDWRTLKSSGRVEFAFIKATDGGDHLDKRFHENFWAAREAGVLRSGYHFYYFCRPAIEQVAWYAQNVPNDPEALPPVLDVEWGGHPRTCRRRPPREEVLREMTIWLTEIERIYGKKPVIYTSIDFHEENLEGQFLEYPKWVRSVATYPANRYEDRKWTFWQYTEEGRLPGIDGHVDRNVFAGSKKEWRKWALGQIDHKEVWRY